MPALRRRHCSSLIVMAMNEAIQPHGFQNSNDRGRNAVA